MAIAFISFGVWVHHMFATGRPAQAMGVLLGRQPRRSPSPAAVLYFAWIATMWGGRSRFDTADAVRARASW